MFWACATKTYELPGKLKRRHESRILFTCWNADFHPNIRSPCNRHESIGAFTKRAFELDGVGSPEMRGRVNEAVFDERFVGNGSKIGKLDGNISLEGKSRIVAKRKDHRQRRRCRHREKYERPPSLLSRRQR